MYGEQKLTIECEQFIKVKDTNIVTNETWKIQEKKVIQISFQNFEIKIKILFERILNDIYT